MWDITEREGTLRWAIASIVGVLVLTAISTFIYPREDAWAFARVMFSRGAPLLVKTIAAMGIILMFALVEKGDVMREVRHEKYGTTVIICVVLVCVFFGG